MVTIRNITNKYDVAFDLKKTNEAGIFEGVVRIIKDFKKIKEKQGTHGWADYLEDFGFIIFDDEEKIDYMATINLGGRSLSLALDYDETGNDRFLIICL